MIVVHNNFLPSYIFTLLQNYCKENEFKIIKRGEKEFSVLPVPDYVKDFLQVPDYELTLSFIRCAYEGFDNDLRIHADNIIEGKKTAVASVLYISTQAETTPNGTAFWKHHEHGIRLPEDVTDEEFDRLLTDDSNDINKWELRDIVWAEPNRHALYEASYFHSKWPQEITVGKRIVLVSFYSKIENNTEIYNF